MFFLFVLIVLGCFSYYALCSDTKPIPVGTYVRFKVIKDNPEDGQASIRGFIGMTLEGTVVKGERIRHNNSHTIFHFDEVKIL